MRLILEKIIEYGLYLFVFLLPWQTRWIWHEGYLAAGNWEYGSFSLYASEIILLILLILNLFLRSNISYKENKNIWIFVAGLLFISFISISWAEKKDVGFYVFSKLIEGIIIFWIIFKNKINFSKLGIAIVASGFIQGILAIYQFLNQGFSGSKWLGLAPQSPDVLGTIVVETSSGRFLRAYGSLPHPNMLAGFLVICLFILIALYLNFYTSIFQSKVKYNVENVLKLFLILSSFVVISFGLFLTFSRAAIISFIIGLFLIWLVFLFRKNKKYIWLIGKMTIFFIICAIVLFSIFPEPFQTRVLAQDRLEIKSNQQRSEYYTEAKELFTKNWIKGVGLGNYTNAVYSQLGSDKESWDYQPVHNIYFLIACEISVFGLAIFLLLIFEVLKKIWKKINLNPVFSIKDNWFLFSSVIFINFLMIGLFDHYFWSLAFGVWIFWLVLGMCIKNLTHSHSHGKL